MQRLFERVRRQFTGFTRVTVSLLSMLGLITSMTAALSFKQAEIVWEDGTSQVLLTVHTQPEDILTAAGIDLLQNDEVVFAQEASGLKVYIYSSFLVPLAVDGAVKEDMFAVGTVADVLKEHNVQLGEYDMVEPALETELVRDMEIKVTRVEFEEAVSRREVLEEQVEDYIAALPDEQQQNNFKRSKSRIYDVTAVDRFEDGVIVSSEYLDMVAVFNPVDEPKALPFMADEARSTIDYFHGIELDEEGIPTSYSRIIEGANATAYSSSGTGLGAGGQGLYCGTVAVNPNEIPYGTRLYIRSTDGSFIYGYAIASDTGIAMMDGRAAVDLYFESNAECNTFGRRWLDVYVLD